MKQPENVRTFDQLHNDVYDFIEGVFDKEFSLNDVCRYYDFKDGNQRRIVDYWLRMAIVEGLIERSGKKWGWFRKLDSGLEKMKHSRREFDHRGRCPQCREDGCYAQHHPKQHAQVARPPVR